jgi:hypothetical protein
MLRKTRNDAAVPIPVAHDRVTVVIVYNITGNIMSCQAVYSHLKPRRHMIGLWRTSSKSGARN